MDTFQISNKHSTLFAQLSGDFNPLHLEPMVARRSPFGGTVAHGMHICLTALDHILKDLAQPIVLTNIKAQFAVPVRSGDTLTIQTRSKDQKQIKLGLWRDKRRVQSITVHWKIHDTTTQFSAIPEVTPTLHPCKNPSFDELAKAEGSTPLYLEPALLQQLFPSLFRLLPPMQMAPLLAITRIIGMECPGYNALFTGFDVKFNPQEKEEPAVLQYQTMDADLRFSEVRLAVQSPGMKGELEAFFRPPPINQDSLSDIKKRVEPTLFSNQKALIIGGSRGLGEVCAKIIAAGGGDTLITYHMGQTDAERVQTEITKQGHLCKIRPFNVLSQPENLKDLLLEDWYPTHLYYFATPGIDPSTKNEGWNHTKFILYCTYYVTGFQKTVQSVLQHNKTRSKHLTLFYPSTVFIGEDPHPEFWEYAVAKGAGETLCHQLQATLPNVRCFHPRLPRVLTDQTNTILSLNPENSATVLINALKF